MKLDAVFVLILVVVGLGAAVVVSGVQSKKPEIEMDEGIPTPTSHEPLEHWIVNHPKELEEHGRDSCLLCHDRRTTCDACHSYVGITREIYQ